MASLNKIIIDIKHLLSSLKKRFRDKEQLVMVFFLMTLFFISFSGELKSRQGIVLFLFVGVCTLFILLQIDSFRRIREIQRSNKKIEQGQIQINERCDCLMRMVYDSTLKLNEVYPREDVTVIIGVKNRCGFRLENALKSIRNQDYDQKMVNIILVDYDSASEFIDKIRESCQKYNAQYLRIDNKPVWSRSRCLNIAIKKTRTKYLLLSDVDIVFEKNYISQAVKELQEDPYQVLYYPMRDSQENDIYEGLDVLREYPKLSEKAIFRRDMGKIYLPHGVSICFLMTEFIHRIRGLDEKYIVWGKEDHDLIRRLNLIGLKLTSLEDKTSYIHQYHPKHEGIKSEHRQEWEKNKIYFSKTNTILRNDKGWGGA